MMLEYVCISLTKTLQKDAILFSTSQLHEKHAREEYYEVS